MKYAYYQNVEKDAEGRPLGFFGYQPGQQLLFIERGEVEFAGSVTSLLEDLFGLHNMDDRPYRKKVRSMSVGDMVILELADGPQAWVVDHVGWKKVELPSREALNAVWQTYRRNA